MGSIFIQRIFWQKLSGSRINAIAVRQRPFAHLDTAQALAEGLQYIPAISSLFDLREVERVPSRMCNFRAASWVGGKRRTAVAASIIKMLSGPSNERVFQGTFLPYQFWLHWMENEMRCMVDNNQTGLDVHIRSKRVSCECPMGTHGDLGELETSR